MFVYSWADDDHFPRRTDTVTDDNELNEDSFTAKIDPGRQIIIIHSWSRDVFIDVISVSSRS